MKHIIIFLLLLLSNSTYGQITISNDSIMFDSELIGKYSFFPIGRGELNISILMSMPFSAYQKDAFQKEIPKVMLERNYQGFTYSFQYFIDQSKASPSQLAGIDLEKAGKAYNDAATTSLVVAVIGAGVVLSGEPIIGGIITLGGGIIGFILNISGNNKIIKAARALQKQK
jgi:hypothetical protein